MTSKPGATEFTFAFSNVGGAVELTGNQADARRIQNVLLGKRRSGCSPYGLDLKSYLLEIRDSQSTAEVEGRATEQVSRYTPGIRVNALVVEQPETQAGGRDRRHSLVVGVSLGSQSGSYNFGLLAFQDPTGSVVSNLVL